ncbi:hypothetical protein [Shinella sp.]|uniref:hypothetical protein n=1 Tax=Shinella sp. TaxID=1870904 RepID=UPI00289C89D7|nr:hypothetical protein [Shinella sp.]
MKVTNISAGPRGLNTKAGPVLVEPKDTVEVELSEAEYKVSKGTGWFDFSGEPVKPVDEFKAPFEAKDKGAGWWAIYDADGKEVRSLRKDDAEIFNALSDADKATEVAKK